MFREDDEDAQFIDSEEEGDDVLGVPAGIPIEFTHYARKKASELFKYAVEWSVQKLINPGFPSKDELYELSFRKLDDELKALANSKFVSSVWKPDFTASLKSRPEIAFEALEPEEVWMHPKCEACNRSNHPCTYQLQFQGKPYHPHTLEEVAPDEDDDDENDDSASDEQQSDDDDQPAYDYRGNEVPPASKIYFVGKFCMANAETGHALQHWRFHLNEWIVMWLISHGYMTNEKIVKREKQSTRKRKKEANKITDRMEKEGEIRRLWHEFKKNSSEARSSKQGRYLPEDY
ncbi:hypothetical protein BAUCODRAFT_66999 [Baudoinia panamericana UAMH 10762]|uniref:DUF4211 domain-containing protein n=1 Tax=Baudoinia panamericana (strain UAMH 10762) TaxID=717646 RepID=M2NGY3_BAUPA|nr:uncharacterized protein BAUCODRAFT_66999 [Baudoinia panamericana UAMH 10762]EMC98275.1 hypothetical protein BAUCODRAFT_66999 [Baudoinia panamericana UAMH 10762]